MNTESDLMGWLNPPDHGLSELKRKIARRTARNKAVAGISATTFILVAATAAIIDGIEPTAPPAVSDRQWQAAISMQEEKLKVLNGAALELSAPDSETRIYLVSTMPEKSPPGSG